MVTTSVPIPHKKEDNRLFGMKSELLLLHLTFFVTLLKYHRVRESIKCHHNRPKKHLACWWNKAKGVSHPCYNLNLLKNQTSQSSHRRTESKKSKEESQSWGWTLNWLVLSFTLAVQWHEAQFASYIIQSGSFICTVLYCTTWLHKRSV
jgi:hypothetical protein